MTSTATFVAQTLPLVSLPFYFQEMLQFSPVKTGLLMTPWAVGVAAAAPLAGWFADRMPVSTLAGSGLLVMTAGLIAMLCLPGDSSAVMIGLRLGICGVGFGFFHMSAISSVYFGRTTNLKDLDRTQSPFAASREISIEGCEGASIARR